MASNFVHATVVVVGEHGVLFRGASGSGKSTLARHVVERVMASGSFARLVGDDKVSLTAHAGRVVARCHPEISGKIEVAGFGIVDAAAEPAAVVRLVVDVGPAPERMPHARTVQLCGVDLPAIAVPQRASIALDLVICAIERLVSVQGQARSIPSRPI